LLSKLDSLSVACNRDLWGLDVLVNLNSASTPCLQIFDSLATAANYFIDQALRALNNFTGIAFHASSSHSSTHSSTHASSKPWPQHARGQYW
jgi:hypothetical protein